MADQKFSELDPVVSLVGNEIIPVIQSGVPKRTTPQDIVDLASSDVNSVNAQTGHVVLDQDDVLDGTTYKQYSATEKTKLAGIASGAEVNVQPDWNAGSGDGQILNKPTIPTVSDAAYDSSWNGSTDAPTKNAVYDKIETLSGGGGLTHPQILARTLGS